MQAALDALLESSAFSPHGFCLLWEPSLIWVRAISDGLIGLAYYSIPLAFLQFIWRRKDIDFGWIIGLFGAFILACGTIHFMSIVTLWEPQYWLEGIIKLLTAFLSVATAILLWPQLPRLLAMPSPSELRPVNQALFRQIQERDRNAGILREREAQLLQSQKMKGLG